MKTVTPCAAGQTVCGRRSELGMAARAVARGRGTPVALACVLVLIGGRHLCIAAPNRDGAICADCHPTQGQQFSNSLHARADYDCRTCHGGERLYQVSESLVEQYVQAQGSDLAAPPFEHGRSFTGKPRRADVPERCGHCHADVEVMNPYGLRTDQLARYETSGHGKRLRTKDDDRVAVCIDCHGTHDVVGAKDPKSPIHPLHVPDTCGRCHEDAVLMAEFGLSSQVVRQFKQSVHGQGLLEARDESMPTCATCHGNHGARPPGVADVGHVCAQCHQQTEEYFQQSVHAKFPNFPVCVGCHSPNPDLSDHRILSVTRPPEALAEAYTELLTRLSDRNASRAEIGEALHAAIEKDDRDAPVRLGQICQRCHVAGNLRGHRMFFEDVDREAVAAGAELEQVIQNAEARYARTSWRVDRVARGVLLVEQEAFSLEQARTHLISLAAVQHTLDPNRVGQTAGALFDVCQEIDTSLDAKEAGLRWRYRALGPLWGFLAVFILALWIKYKRLRHVHVAPYRPGEGARS